MRIRYLVDRGNIELSIGETMREAGWAAEVWVRDADVSRIERIAPLLRRSFVLPVGVFGDELEIPGRETPTAIPRPVAPVSGVALAFSSAGCPRVSMRTGVLATGESCSRAAALCSRRAS